MKHMAFRARQRRLKNKVRRDEWSRLMENHSPINNSEVWNLDVYTVKYVAPRLKKLIKIITEKNAPGVYTDGVEPKGLKPLASSVDEFQIWQQMLEDMLFAFEYYADRYARYRRGQGACKERIMALCRMV